jgi:PQQ-like domain
MKKTYVFLCLIFSTFAFAQRQATSTQAFTTNIENMIINPKTGFLYVKEDTKISAYSNVDKKVLWEVGEEQIGTKSSFKKIAEIDLAAIGKDEDDFELVDGSDYLFAKINGRELIIDGISGEVLFNSEKAMVNAVIVKQFFLPEENSFGFVVIEKKKFLLKYFDLVSGKVVWEAPMGNDAGFAGAFSKSQMTRKDRIESFNDNLYALVNNNLFSFEKASGKVKWSLPDINQFYVCQNNKNLVVVRNKGGMISQKKTFNLIEIANGKQLWKNDVETKSILKLEDWGDKILVAHYSGFNMYNYNDGSKYWKKDVKGSDFKQVLSLGSDFLYVSGKDMILIDKEGKDKWKNDIEISDNTDDLIHYLGLSKSGKVMYITSTYGNMVDYNTGKKLWKRNIKFDKDRPLLYTYDEAKDAYLIYND